MRKFSRILVALTIFIMTYPVNSSAYSPDDARSCLKADYEDEIATMTNTCSYPVYYEAYHENRTLMISRTIEPSTTLTWKTANVRKFRFAVCKSGSVPDKLLDGLPYNCIKEGKKRNKHYNSERVVAFSVTPYTNSNASAGRQTDATNSSSANQASGRKMRDVKSCISMSHVRPDLIQLNNNCAVRVNLRWFMRGNPRYDPNYEFEQPLYAGDFVQVELFGSQIWVRGCEYGWVPDPKKGFGEDFECRLAGAW